MAKRSISPPHTKCDIDWNKCFICQRGKSGPKDLTCPANRDGQGYSTFVTDVETFNDLVDTEEHFDLTLINEGEGPERTLKHRKASWHQSCRIKYSKTKIIYRDWKLRKNNDDLTRQLIVPHPLPQIIS